MLRIILPSEAELARAQGTFCHHFPCCPAFALQLANFWLFPFSLAAGLEWKHVDFEWEDLTAQFTAASSNLKIGEIIATESFNLQEAMSAIELMDPKMDIGLGSANVLILPEIEARERLPKIETLSEANLISLMDSLIIAELMHYEGYHLAQGLLTCYYLHDVTRCLEKSPILHNFVRVLYKRCGIIRECFNEAGNFYDEDFVHYNFGFAGIDVSPKEEIKTQHNELIASEEARIKALSVSGTAEDEAKRKIAEAILVRLKWNFAMYLAQKEFSVAANAGLTNAKAYIAEANSYFDQLVASAVLAENPEVSSSKTAGGADVIAESGKSTSGVKIFEYEIMRRWTNATPPTIKPWKTLEESMIDWRSILAHLTELTDLPTIITCFRDAKEYLSELTVEKKAPLLPRARCLMIIWSNHKFLGKVSLEDLLVQELTTQFGLNTKYLKADEKTLAFHLNLCETGVGDWLRALAITRSRARRRLPHIFDNWGTLLYDGDVLDAKIPPLLKIQREEEKCRGFARWHVDVIQTMISDYLTIGFEQQLYEPYEIPTIFWYLDNLAASRQKSQFKVLEALETHKQSSLHAATAKRGAGGARNQKSNAASPPPQNVEVKPNWYAVELDAKFQLTRALFLLVASFDAAGFFAIPRTVVSSPQTRYFLRFHPLINLSMPKGLRFEQYQSTYIDLVKDRPPLDLLQRAHKAAQSSIRAFMTLSSFSQLDGTSSTPTTPPPSVTKEAQALLKIALANGITIAKFKQSNELDACKTLKDAKTDNAHNKPSHKPSAAVESGEATTSKPVPTNSTHYVDLDFSGHRSFPLITLKAKEAPK